MDEDARMKLAKALGRARQHQRLAVRWLNDASRFRENFGIEEGWKRSDLGETAQLIYDDAVREVVRIAKVVDERYRKLEDYDDRNIRKR